MRVGELQVASPVRLTLLKIIDGPPTLEKKLHHHFGQHWIRGEWFRAAPDLLAYIDNPTSFPNDEVVPFEEPAETRKVMNCNVCGTEFISDAKHPWQKFCGVGCRIRAHRRLPRITEGRIESSAPVPKRQVGVVPATEHGQSRPERILRKHGCARHRKHEVGCEYCEI